MNLLDCGFLLSYLGAVGGECGMEVDIWCGVGACVVEEADPTRGPLCSLRGEGLVTFGPFLGIH